MECDSSENLTASTSSYCSCTGNIWKYMSNLRRVKNDFDGEFALVQNHERRWSKIFTDFVLKCSNCTCKFCSTHSDDMLWYVLVPRTDSSFYMERPSGQLRVFRKQNPNQPKPGDPTINWEETVSLNIILQLIDFDVTCAVCTKTSPQNLQILRKNCQRVYPSPSRRRMDSKGDGEEITFPKIYFAIDDFEEVSHCADAYDLTKKKRNMKS
ncbi:hypothetical protein AB6A40_003508 [Gnathostoma spinigerum]|uniref:Uncharacterized protein n=1 Tax=Gnathostoma spinigerum TaxID=75299 RepID=A0ABD6E9R5_9BILA